MGLYGEILCEILSREEAIINFPNLKVNVAEIIEWRSYQALQKIKSIIEDDTLSDFECIEAIACVFVETGSNGGNRHDFG